MKPILVSVTLGCIFDDTPDKNANHEKDTGFCFPILPYKADIL
jgi:hypothetical protein